MEATENYSPLGGAAPQALQYGLPGRNAGSVPKFLPAARQGRLVVDVKHDCVWLDHAVTAVEGELFRFTCSGICVLRVRRLPLKGIDL